MLIVLAFTAPDVVTLKPVGIITSSLVVGTNAGDQLLAVFQSAPDPTNVIVAELSIPALKKAKIAVIRLNLSNRFFFFIF